MTVAARCPFPWLVVLLGVVLQTMASRAESIGVDHGLLFEVRSASADAPSYLFGTIHSEDPRVTALPSQVEGAFDACSGFALEVVPDASAIIKAMMTMTYTDGRQLRDVLPGALYAEVKQALAELGMGEEAFKDFKPWAVMTQLSTPRGETGNFLDMRLYRGAVAEHKRIVGLETMEEQLAIFDRLDEGDQIALLEETLEARGELPKMFEQLTLAYLQRDLARLQWLSDAYLEESEPRLAALFRAKVVDARNRRMASRMASLLDEGGWFVAIGALHLTGETGVVGLLRDMGYSVERLY